MLKKIVVSLVAGVMLTACAGDESVKVASLQKKDKNLNCREIMLEINEAEFYRKTAEGNKNLKIKSLFMPLGYISTYVDAEDAVGAADARVDYLNRIYDILNCDDPASRAKVANNIHKGNYRSGSGGYSASNTNFAPIKNRPTYYQYHSEQNELSW